MSAFDKFLKSAKVKDPFEVLALGTALTSSEGKARAVAKAIADIAIWRLTPMAVTLGGAFLGVRGIIQAIVKESGALEAAWQRLGRLQVYQGTLEPLLKSAVAARGRLAELVVFANKFNLPLGQVVAANRALEVFGRGALSSAKNMETAGAIARATGQGVEAAGYAYGNLYHTLEGGAPIAQAGQEMLHMGVITEGTIRQVDRLQESGASFAQVWATVEESIAANTKNTADFGSGVDALQNKLEDAREAMATAFGAPFLVAEKKGMENSIVIAQQLTPVMKALGGTLATVTDVGSNLGGGLLRWITSWTGLSAAVNVASKAFVALGLGYVVSGAVSLTRVLWQAVTAIRAVGIASAVSNLEIMLLQRSLQATGPISAKAFDLAAQGAGYLRTALTGVTGGFMGLLRAIVLSPFMAFAAVATVIGAAWADFQDNKAAEEAFKETVNASNKAVDAIERQVRAVQSLEDAFDALRATQSAVKAAQEEYAKAAAANEQPGFVGRSLDGVLEVLGSTKKGRDGVPDMPNEAQAWLDERRGARQMRQATEDAAQQKVLRLGASRAEVITKINSGQFQTSGQEAVTQGAARRELHVASVQRQQRIEDAKGENKVVLRRSYAADETRKFAEGQGTAEARAKFNAQSEAIRAQGLSPTQTKIRIADTAHNSDSAIIREEQALRERREKSRTPEEFADVLAAEQALAIRREDVEMNRDQHRENAVAATHTANEEERGLRMQQIGQDAEKEKTALRSEGMQRTRDEADITIRESRAQMEALRADDTQGREAAQTRIDAAEQSLAMAEKEHALAESRAGTERKIAELKGVGPERAAKEFHLKDAELQKEMEIEQAKPGGGDKARLDELAGQRASLTRQQIENQRETAISRGDVDRRIAEGRAIKAGQGEKAIDLANLGDFSGNYERTRGLYGDTDEAKQKALALTNTQIEANAAAPVASSLARIGGGGGVSDPLLGVAEQQRRLAEEANTYLATLAGATKAPDASPEPAEYHGE